jgi:hypothetical protein
VENFFLALEVEVDRTVSNARFASNVGHLGIEVSVVSKNADSRAQDCFAFIADDGANWI